MNLRVLEKRIKNVVVRAELAINRRLGRVFIPARLEAFNIETSSICNLSCRFCAYEKKQSPRVSMPNEMFFDCVDQAADLGFSQFSLTPCTGDVFMDKHVFDKFSFLDAHPKVAGYGFFSNLTAIGPDQLMRLMGLKKFKSLTISVYGHDEKSFLAIARTTPGAYRRLMSNLEAVLGNMGRWPFGITIGFRSSFDVPREGSSDLMDMIGRLRKSGVHVHESHGIYNNWGGYISQEDVAGLDMHILSSSVPRSGACVKVFDSVMVTATGVVNACNCRDVDATLRIGDIRESSLSEILSERNKAYMEVINEQQDGRFRPACRSCDYYRSIYHQPKSYRRGKVPTQTIEEFFRHKRTVP